MTPEKIYANALKEALKTSGISQKELASLTGIPKQSISNYVNGSSAPSEERKKLIAEVLQLNLNEFKEKGEVKDYVNKLSPEEAATLMNVTASFIREGLKQRRFPFGYAVEMPGGRWSYWIGRHSFEEHTGIKINN